MERKYLIEYVSVTEAAAAASAVLVGMGRKNDADALAVGAMRRAFDRIDARGKVVIGEGEMDEAPMLFIGEVVGPEDPSLPMFDIAVDPLEGTNLCAKDQPGAITTLAVAGEGMLLAAPDMYMDKIATGPAGRGVVDLDRSPRENVVALAAAMSRPVHDIGVVVLERPRHDHIVEELRHAGARVSLISDGDVAPAVAAALPNTGVHMMIGRGGAPEGVLAAAALRALGGEFQGRLYCEDEAQRERAISMGIADPSAKLTRDEIVRGDCIFSATGVTSGKLLRGARRRGDTVELHSFIADSKTGSRRYVDTTIRLDKL
ncbi:MAG: class II fructose-bisphosphatase [Nannocystaceae bacterium]